jgi:hypothetical protein
LHGRNNHVGYFGYFGPFGFPEFELESVEIAVVWIISPTICLRDRSNLSKANGKQMASFLFSAVVVDRGRPVGICAFVPPFVYRAVIIPAFPKMYGGGMANIFSWILFVVGLLVKFVPLG